MRKVNKKADSLNTSTHGHKEYKYLYQKMLEDDVIRKAYRKLRKGKTKRKEIQYIDAHLDKEVQKMHDMILNTKPDGVCVEHPELAYKPGKRTPKIIFERGKMRKIYIPEIHEQWLHHIIILVLEPIITATAYQYSCGSFPRRGAHYGKRQIERWLKGDPKGTRYFAKMDIRHFYDNIRLDVLSSELAISIKDGWFMYIIRLCLSGFKKRLHAAVAEIRKMLGRRFRLKLKYNYQVCRFVFNKDGQEIRRPLDFMGFEFCRSRTVMRKKIMLAATRLAIKIVHAKKRGRVYLKHIEAMLSYMGWFSCTDTYDCYLTRIKTYINIRQLKEIVSRIQRRQDNERMVKGTMLRETGGTAAYC